MMNKLKTIIEVIKLSKRQDVLHTTDGVGTHKYEYNKGSLSYITIEFGTFYDTRGAWLKYYTKDVAKHYLLNPVERLLLLNCFCED